MLARIWHTTFSEANKEKLVEYATETSFPALSSRPGNRGVFFFSNGDEWITLTLWQDKGSIEKLADDPEYNRIVEGILALDVLGSDQKTTVWNCEGGTAAA